MCTFERQLEIAAQLNAPLFLHQRDAHADFIALLKRYKKDIDNVVVHCFTGTKAELNDYLALDCYIGLTGWVCDERRGLDVLALAADIPLERLLLETDAPFLLPRTIKPKPKSRRNTPANLPHIGLQIAQQFQTDVVQLAAQTLENSLRFFRLSDVERR